MKAHNHNPGPQHQETKRDSSWIKGGVEMKIVSQIQSVKVNLLNGLKINAPAKLLGGLALGAILITTVALSSGTTPASPLSANPVSEV